MVYSDAIQCNAYITKKERRGAKSDYVLNVRSKDVAGDPRFQMFQNCLKSDYANCAAAA